MFKLMEKWPNILLIAGTNRNVGKTTFACKVIKQIALQQAVWAIKITPHIHSLCPSCKTLFQTDDLVISQELSSTELKDSSKMLAAGAEKVFYIQGADNQIPLVLEWFRTNIANDIPLVCESAALRHFIEPGKFVILSKSDLVTKHADLLPLADLHFNNFQYKLEEFQFIDKQWVSL